MEHGAAHDSVWDCGRARFDLTERVVVMGVLNVTPDSFSDGGLYPDADAAIERALAMVDEGADVIDVGGESTRPGADAVAADEEQRRVVPVIEGLRRRSAVPISIDTMKASTARAALDAGADIVNDVTGLRGDPEMIGLAAARNCGLVVMHMQGTPRDMQQAPRYDDVIAQIRQYFQKRLETTRAANIRSERILLDPGIGFGKTVDHNLELIANLRGLAAGLRPLLMGVSRKSFIGKTLNVDTSERLEGTAAAVAVCVWNGAACVRVHDVRAMRRVADMTTAIRRRVRPGIAAA